MNDPGHRHARWLAPAATLVIGIAIGWTARPSMGADRNQAAAQPEPMRDLRPPRPPREMPAKRPAVDVEALLQGMRVVNGVVAVDVEDPKAAVLALAGRAGIYGLDYNEQQLLGGLCGQWYDQQPDAALDWILSQPKAKDVEQLLSAVAGHLARDGNLTAAIDFAVTHGSSQGREMKMPYAIVEMLGSLGPGDFARACSAFTTTNAWAGSSGVFPADFAFRETLDALVAAKHELPKGRNFSHMPSNLLTEWAKQDPDAAWAWAQAGNEVAYNGIEQLITEYGRTATTEQVANYAAQLINDQAGDSEKNLHHAWQLLSNRPNSEVVGAFLRQMQGDRQRNLERVFATAMRGSGPDYDAFKEMLLGQMTAEERVQLLQQRHSRNPEFRPILSRLGHSDDEITKLIGGDDP